jgi:hypothetical protein
MVSVLDIEPKVCGFKPCRGQWIFKGDNIPQHAFIGREVKPSAPCRVLLTVITKLFEV